MKDNLFIESLKQSTGMRVFIYLVILLISSLIGVAFSMLFMFSSDTGLKIENGINSALMFIVPPIAFYLITRKKDPMQALGLRKVASPAWMLLLVGVIVMFVSLPVTNQLSTWNEAMKFGPAFEKLETWIKNLEDSAAAITERMLNVNTISGLLLNLLIIALIPAVGEELTFRGVLQQSLTHGLKNPHIAIVLSASIFSFIHFQFYGFLPRLFLGLLLGYMFYITGSLWTSILMHFLNNGTAVVLYYLNNRDIIHVDVEHFGALDNPWLVAASALVTVGLIVWSWWRAKQ